MVQRPIKRAPEPPPSGPKAGRIVAIGRAQRRHVLLALVAALLVLGGVAALLSAGASRAAAPAPAIVYYAAAEANASQAILALTAVPATAPAPPPPPAHTQIAARPADPQPGAPPADAVQAPAQGAVADALAALPPALQALKWWSSAADAAVAPGDVSVSAAGLAAIALQTRPIIPASSDQVLIKPRPAAVAPVEFTPVPAAAGHPPCVGQTGTLVTDTLRSELVSRPLPVHVWLPPCHDPVAHKYPALYLIQGSAYLLGQWLVHGAPQAAELLIGGGTVEPFIIVMPGSDMWVTGQGKYMWSQSGPNSWETVIADELVPMIERKYGARPDRDSRAIGGISRGGYWSIEIGFARPDVFGTVGAHSPAISRDILIGEGSGFSMLNYAKSVDDLRTQRIWLDAGDGDWARTGMDELAGQLRSRGVAFVRTLGKGGHVDGYWTSRIDDYIAFYSRGWSYSASRAAMPETGGEGGQ